MSHVIVDLNADTFKKGDVLTRSGKTATVAGPAIHRTSRKFIGYDVDLLTDGSGFVPQRVTLFTADIRHNWTFKPAQVAFPIGVPFELNAAGEVVPEDTPVGEQHAAPSADERTAAFIADLQEQIAQLRLRNSKLEERNTELNESLDSAIDHDAAAADRQIEVAAQLHTENDKLTEQLAEARAQLASFKVNAPATTAANPIPAPVQEVRIHRDITSMQLADMLNDGWQTMHMQFMPAGDDGLPSTLNVVLSRYFQPTPTPQPLRTSVRPVGPQVTIIQPDEVPSPLRSFEDHIAEVLEVGQRVYENALTTSPIPAYRPLSNLLTGGK